MAVSSLGELLTRLSQRAGLARDVHPHMFRHALATNMADHGVTSTSSRRFSGTARFARPSPTCIRATA